MIKNSMEYDNDLILIARLCLFLNIMVIFVKVNVYLDLNEVKAGVYG